MMPRGESTSSVRLVALVCAAQVLVQIGAFFWPALLPQMIPRWSLTNSEAGWITAAFYGAYILAVPVLVTLPDRIGARLFSLCGVAATVVGHALFATLADGFWSALAARALTGIGWAGTYMTGLKLLSDVVDGKLLSRAATGHAASIGISGALSFACADLLAGIGGWGVAFFSGGGGGAGGGRGGRRGGRWRAGSGGWRRRAALSSRRSRRAHRCSTSGPCCATAPPWPMRS